MPVFKKDQYEHPVMEILDLQLVYGDMDDEGTKPLKKDGDGDETPPED